MIMLCIVLRSARNERDEPQCSLASEVDDALHDARVCQRGCIAQLIILLNCNLAQDAPHDFAGPGLGQT